MVPQPGFFRLENATSGQGHGKYADYARAECVGNFHRGWILCT